MLDVYFFEVNVVCFGFNSSFLVIGGVDCLIYFWNVVGSCLEVN